MTAMTRTGYPRRRRVVPLVLLRVSRDRQTRHRRPTGTKSARSVVRHMGLRTQVGLLAESEDREQAQLQALHGLLRWRAEVEELNMCRFLKPPAIALVDGSALVYCFLHQSVSALLT